MDRRIEALGSRLEHVPEPAMRRALLREWLEQETAAAAHAGLRAALEGPACPLRDAVQELLVAPTGAPGDGLSYSQIRALYERAVKLDDATTARLLRASGGTGEALRSGEPPLPLDLADVPLGRRRALARSADGGWLERLARDSDPLVIRNWLQNPRILEGEVVRLAASRPVARSALEEIARHARWRSNEAVKSALARNPYSPLPVALRAAAGLSLPRLRRVADDPDIHPELRDAAREAIARRS